MTTVDPSRPRTKPRNPALCCRCGTIRTVCVDYIGPRRLADDPTVPDDAHLTWLRCAACGRSTWHAQVNDRGPCAGRDHREEANEVRSRAIRRLRRELAGLEATGTDVRWVAQLRGWSNERVVVGLTQFKDASRTWFRLQLVRGIAAEDLLDALEAVIDFVDGVDDLGPWRQGTHFEWRAMGGLTRHQPTRLSA